jgi:sugar O-acyltransferase (sialic acid O-acetyltransferase NeuD family)
MKELAIIGAGGFGREVMSYVNNKATFYVSDHMAAPPIRPLSQMDCDRSDAVIAIGNPLARQTIANNLRHGQEFANVIHEVTCIGDSVSLGHGAIITPFAVITVDCKIGTHFHANLHSDVGHDCVIGNFVTLAPSARISGRCTIGNRVYIGTNAVVKEGISICDDVTIGAGAVVLSDITEKGTYVGMPAKRIK